jgi:hypothetical protein
MTDRDVFQACVSVCRVCKGTGEGETPRGWKCPCDARHGNGTRIVAGRQLTPDEIRAAGIKA